MKLAVLPLAIALTLSNSLLAAQNPAGRQQPDLDALATHLQLDASQTEQLKTIMQSHRESRDQMRQQKGQSHALRDQHEQELLAVLNYEQLYNLKKYMRQQKRSGKNCQSRN